MSTATRRRGPRLSFGLLALALVVCGLAALVAVAVRGAPPPASRAQQVHQIAAELRCPVCDDLSVADSPAPLAAQMRQQIADDLAAGRTPDQIRQRFVAAYGDTVLLSPPHRGVGQVAYLLPALVLGAGVVGAALLLRGWRRQAGRGAPVRDPDAGGEPDAHGENTAAGAGAGGDQPRLSAADRRGLERALARLREEEA